MIPQRLSMIRSEDEERGPSGRPNVVEQRSERLVDSRDLAHVRIGGELRGEGRRRDVWGMAVVDVNEQEAPWARVVGPPWAGPGAAFLGGGRSATGQHGRAAR